MPRTAIITGASSGIGKAFVKALLESSDCPDKIWIVARRIDRLNEMAQLSDKLVPVQADLLVADIELYGFGTGTAARVFQ